MKICLDISQVVFEGTGVGTYTSNLAKVLPRVDKSNEYIFFGASLGRRAQLTQFATALDGKKKLFPFSEKMLTVLWNKIHVLPIEAFVGKMDIYHSSDWLQAPSGAKKVTTVHDMIVYRHPDSSHPKIVANIKEKMNWVKKEVDMVIADSQATKDDLIDILHLSPEKIRVIPLAASQEFVDWSTRSETSKKGEISRVKEKYRLTSYFLSVGTKQPRKNLGRLIEAYRQLKTETELILVGNSGWGQGQNPISGVRELGFVSASDMPALYAGAVSFVYPSLYEGFGIPILEAMHCDTPVITSNVSSLPEAGGEAAIYVDPLKIESIRSAMSQVQEMSEIIRNQQAQLGLKQAQKFSWEKVARETIKVYEELA